MDNTLNDRPPTVLIDGAFSQDGENYCRSALIVAAICCYAPTCHFHHASNSLIHTTLSGGRLIHPGTIPSPASPYGFAKDRVMYLIDMYRKNRDLLPAAFVLFNHDSPLKKSDFLLPRIANFVAQVVNDSKSSGGKLPIHNIAVSYDLSSALMVAQQVLHITILRLKGDYVLASGRATSVKRYS